MRKLLEKAQLDLRGFKNVDRSGSTYQIADLQADILVEALKKVVPDIEWKVVDSSDTKKNLYEGDVNGFKNGECVCMIDLKVADINTAGYIGTIDLNSILHFANNDKAVYICATWEGEHYLVFSGKDVYNLFNSNTKTMLPTRHYNRTSEVRPSLDKYRNRFYRTPAGVSPYDFMGTTALMRLKKQLDNR